MGLENGRWTRQQAESTPGPRHEFATPVGDHLHLLGNDLRNHHLHLAVRCEADITSVLVPWPSGPVAQRSTDATDDPLPSGTSSDERPSLCLCMLHVACCMLHAACACAGAR